MSKRSPESELRMKSPSSPVAATSSSASAEWPEVSLSSSSYSSKMAIRGSCALSPKAEEIVKEASAPEAKAMPLVGCPRCFMYVMLSEVDPKCPKCKSTAFLDFFREEDLKTDS